MTHEYNLRVGSVLLSLEFELEDQMNAFIEYFRRPSLPGPGDIRLELSFAYDVPSLPSISDSLFLTKKGDGNGFSAGDGLISGRYSPESGEGELLVQAALLEGSFVRVFEQILYQAYWSASRRKGIDSLLLHSCGMIREGLGYVFTGKSGSGKSTVASISDGSAVLNDEICIIELSAEGATLRDSPFNGLYLEKVEGSAPLAGVMLLRQAPFHLLTSTRAAESVKVLSREVIPPMGLETAFSRSAYWDMLEYAHRLSDLVPLYILDFLPDPGFWPLIEAIERRSDDQRR